MKKVFKFGKVDAYNIGKRNCLVTVEVELKLDREGCEVFTASGNVWNNLKTDIIQGGQCLDDLIKFKELKYNKQLLLIHDLWKKYHLNNMNAGTLEQSQALEKWHKENGTRFDYTKDVEYLKSIDLYEVTLKDGSPYKYGHSWLYREIPENDLNIIKTLLSNE